MPDSPAIDKAQGAFVTMLDASVTANESSNYFLRDAYHLHSIQVWNDDTENAVTVKVYASNDAQNWAQVGSDITTDGVIQLAGLFRYLKVVRDNTTHEATVTCYSGDKFRK